MEQHIEQTRKGPEGGRRSLPAERRSGRPRLLTTASSGRLVQGMRSARERAATDDEAVDEPALAVAEHPRAVFECLERGDVDAFVVEVTTDAANGPAWIEGVRATRPAVPVVAVLERGDAPARARALSAGADACLGLDEIAPRSLARAVRLAAERREIRSWVQRTSRAHRDGARLRFGSFEVDAANLVLRKQGRSVAIHRTPLRLLIHLARNAGRTVSRRELIEKVWSGVAVSDCAVASALKELRRALGDDGARQRLIETRRGIGYRFVGEVTPADAGDGA